MISRNRIDLFIIGLLFTGCSLSTNPEDNKLKMGRYIQGSVCGEDQLIIRKDGTYLHTFRNENTNFRQTGEWHKSDYGFDVYLERYVLLYNDSRCELLDTTMRSTLGYSHKKGVLSIENSYLEYTHESIYVE